MNWSNNTENSTMNFILMIWHIVQYVITSYSIINKSSLINWWAILEIK